VPMYFYYHDDSVLFKHELSNTPVLAEFSLHVHNNIELYYFVRGSAKFKIESSAYHIAPDTFVLIRPIEAHTIEFSDLAPYERYVLNFPIEFLDEIDPEHTLLEPFFDRALGERNFYSVEEFDISPKMFFDAMADESTGIPPVQRIRFNLYALLCQIKKAFQAKSRTPLDETPSSKIITYVNLHLFEQLNVESIASAFFISVTKLNRIFRNATGASVWKYIISKRLVAARKLIQSGESATRACSKCGFNDYPSFYRMYVKQFGASPKHDLARFKK